ncbi:hypothetical protein CC80DRAFT_583997 [Byssothecium circinans]|uniref:Uncharacterized protein n=1 Tax=Byssothecium circinans TaxID=147558 RepID=A0A6A5U5E4_9PLEO|nr:hypothetical protein CC80DRAFT_583997 [Byssothecium circinans]
MTSRIEPINYPRDAFVERLQGPSVQITIITNATNPHTYTLPQNLVTRDSKFFVEEIARLDNANGSKTSSSPNVYKIPLITLKNVDNFIFGLYLRYLYYGHYPTDPDYNPTFGPGSINVAAVNPPTTTASGPTPARTHSIGLIPLHFRAWVFGASIRSPRFQNFVIQHIYKGIGVQFSLTPRLVAYVWMSRAQKASNATATSTSATATATNTTSNNGNPAPTSSTKTTNNNGDAPSTSSPTKATNNDNVPSTPNPNNNDTTSSSTSSSSTPSPPKPTASTAPTTITVPENALLKLVLDFLTAHWNAPTNHVARMPSLAPLWTEMFAKLPELHIVVLTGQLEGRRIQNLQSYWVEPSVMRANRVPTTGGVGGGANTQGQGMPSGTGTLTTTTVMGDRQKQKQMQRPGPDPRIPQTINKAQPSPNIPPGSTLLAFGLVLRDSEGRLRRRTGSPPEELEDRDPVESPGVIQANARYAAMVLQSPMRSPPKHSASPLEGHVGKKGKIGEDEQESEEEDEMEDGYDAEDTQETADVGETEGVYDAEDHPEDADMNEE